MTNPSVAVVKSDFHGKHSTAWGPEWLAFCAEHGLRHELVDWRALGAFDTLAAHDIVVWHYSHYSRDEMAFAQCLLQALKAAGCCVFPDAGDSTHFDDKVAQAYLLKGLGLATPENYPLHGMAAVDQWIDEIGQFPVVAKLKAGSGASNVQLMHDAAALRRYAATMFAGGVDSRPNALFKIASNIASVRSAGDVVKRLKRAPEFLFSHRNASQREREKGYVYLQEFVPGVDHDVKVVVVGDRLSFVVRAVRSGDFRASGGGSLFYDRTRVPQSMIDAAFHAADAMGSDCTGFDMIIDPRNDRPVILEVSYGFSHEAQLGAKGHFDRAGLWHDEALNAPRALLERLVERVSGR